MGGELKEKAMKCELLPESDIKNICDKVRELFAKEDNVVSVSTPVTIAGDIHGQFHDLLQLFITGGDFSNSKYLFLGDYVDRGRHSVQVISLLFLLKIEYPDKMILLRGNHEARCQTQVFGFYDECLMKYGDSKVWRLFMEDSLPQLRILTVFRVWIVSRNCLMLELWLTLPGVILMKIILAGNQVLEELAGPS